jgi:hypothetical protein
MLVAASALQQARRGKGRASGTPGELMKIYLLMVLISVIAALAHFDHRHEATERQA